MEGNERRQEILKMLKESKKPVAGGAISKLLGVSRQIIVGDIALLRAEGEDIIATNSGYMINTKETEAATTTVKLKHRTEDIYDVLCTIVDEGAKVTGIHVEHDAYGKIEVQTEIADRSKIRMFSEHFLEGGYKTLGDITGGIHYYHLASSSQITLLKVQKALNEKGYLVK